MSGVSQHITKLKTMLLAISLLIVGVNSSNAQEASEHIHTAEAVMKQTFINDVKSDSASFVIDTLNESLEFSLETNSRLLGSSFSLDDNVSVYKGTLSGTKNSWARFTRVNGNMEGAFFDGKDLFIVKSYSELSSILDTNALNQQESIQAQTDKSTSLIINVKDIENSGTCALHNDQANPSQFDIENNQNAFNYDIYVDDLREMLDAQAGKEIEISLFADVEFVSSSNDATADMLTLLNVADGIFSEQIGVQLVLTEATELTTNGSLTSTNPQTLIVAFRNTGLSNPGVSHLFTNKNLDGSTVGIAYVGSLCRSSSVGVTQKLGSKTAIIFAHELGHNFGAPHDNESGSACSSTSSGFVMNPNVNSGGTTFSSCSVQRMEPVVAQAVGNCIVEATSQAPSITSIANLEASIGVDYFYDSDSVVNVNGTGPFTYSLEIAPVGMTIDNSGKITWLPTSDNVGSNTVQVRVSNKVGSDVQFFDVVIEAAVSETFINFNKVTSSSFDDQDKTKSFTVGVSPYEIELTGNTWRSIPFDYEVTSDTVIQFDFRSNNEGEIHGIAFDNDNKISPETTLEVFGTQNWGIDAARYTGQGSTQTISIPVGKYFQGNFDRLVFIMDEDLFENVSESIFSNVRVFEDTEDTSTLNIDELEIISHVPDYQDFSGNVEIIENGKGLKIDGNSWKKVILDSTRIVPSTVLKFDFKSDSIGEIHGVGFFTGDIIDNSRTIQLAGTQDWGIRDFDYSNEGEWQSFVIPIGEYLTTEKVELVFIMDDDRENGTSLITISNSSFRNIKFITD